MLKSSISACARSLAKQPHPRDHAIIEVDELGLAQPSMSIFIAVPALRCLARIRVGSMPAADGMRLWSAPFPAGFPLSCCAS
jgi:hypothetical protein